MNEPIGITGNEVYPIFPLPDFVLFPDVVTALHIFEPRYRKLLSDILDHKGLMCMATLQGDWKKNYHDKSPVICELGCVCHVTDYTHLEDGRYNVVVQGQKKVRLTEIPSDEEYRRAEVAVMDISTVPSVQPDREQKARELAEAVLLREGEAPPELHEHINQLECETLLNVMCFHYPGPVEHKLKMLALSKYDDICEEIIDFYLPLVK